MLLAWQKCFLELDPDAIYMFEVRSHQSCHQCPACQLNDMLLLRISAYLSETVLDLVYDFLLCSACQT